jgi:hypothetical protein
MMILFKTTAVKTSNPTSDYDGLPVRISAGTRAILRFLVDLFIPSWRIIRYYFKLSHYGFHFHPFWFITRYHTIISRYTAWVCDRIVEESTDK